MVESNINWEAIGAIGTCLGAIATFWAVVVALWQTRLTRVKKLNLSFNRNILLYDSGTIDGVSISVQNTGNRNITIQEIGFVLKDASCLTIINNGLVQQAATLPITLEPDSSADFIVILDKLSNSLKKAIQQEKIEENDKLKIFVRDNFNKRYYKKTNEKVKNYIK